MIQVFFSRLIFGMALCGVPAGMLPRSVWAEENVQPVESAPFYPAEISIGEPLEVPLQVLPERKESAREHKPLSQSAQGRDVRPALGAGSGWLGMSVDDSLITGRLVIVEITKKSPAAQSGIQLQDVLLAIDGAALTSSDQLAATLASLVPGQEVKVSVGHGDLISEIVLTATARPREAISRDWQPASQLQPLQETKTPENNLQSTALPPSKLDLLAPVVTGQPKEERGRTALGVRTVPIDSASQARFRLSQASGALVVGLIQDLPASKAGVPLGSVIVAINNQPVRSPSELTQLVASGPLGTPVSLEYVMPGGEARRADVQLQSLEVSLEQSFVPEAKPAVIPVAPRRIAQKQAVLPAGVEEISTPRPGLYLAEEVRRLRARLELLERKLERIEAPRRRY